MEFGGPVGKGDDDHDPSDVLDQYYHDLVNLPPGFRFHPTDEEIVTHYLTPKVINPEFTASAIGQVDLNKIEPWDLPQKAKMGEKEWFFFCQRDRKYPTGMRTNRATDSGYWKATGKDKEIYDKHGGGHGGGGSLVGMKKTLVFYKGRAPKGEKTNWVMHEFRLEGNFSYYNFPKSSKDEWVVCRVVHKNSTTSPSVIINNERPIRSTNDEHEMIRMNSFVNGLLDCPSLPPLVAADNEDTKYNFSSNMYDFNSNTYMYQGGGPMIRDLSASKFQEGTSSGGIAEGLSGMKFKVEQYLPSPSYKKQSISHSQDTGVSTAYDMNNEISSSSMAISKQDDPLVGVPSFSDFDSFWEY